MKFQIFLAISVLIVKGKRFDFLKIKTNKSLITFKKKISAEF